MADQKVSEPVSRVASTVDTKNGVNSYYQLLTIPRDGGISVVGDGPVVEHNENEQTAVILNLTSIHTGDHFHNSRIDSKKFNAPSSGRSSRKVSFAAGNPFETKTMDGRALTKKDIE